jgi:guanine deaminase
MEADIVVIDTASTPAIAQASARAGDIWQSLFPTIMMGDDRAVRAVWVGGQPSVAAPGIGAPA